MERFCIYFYGKRSRGGGWRVGKQLGEAEVAKIFVEVKGSGLGGLIVSWDLEGSKKLGRIHVHSFG